MKLEIDTIDESTGDVIDFTVLSGTVEEVVKAVISFAENAEQRYKAVAERGDSDGVSNS
jgi:hypothetical protein